MMILLLALAATMATSDAPKTEHHNKDALKLTIDSRNPVYSVNVAYAYTTTIWFAVDCYEPSVGNPEVCRVIYDEQKATNRRFVLTPLVDRPGAVTNATFHCNDGVRVVLKLRQTDPQQAVHTVEFQLDPQEEARVREAVEEERRRAQAELDKERVRIEAEVEEAARHRLLQDMIRRYATAEDVEYDRQDFVVAKVFRASVIGTSGYLLFQLKNLTDNDVSVRAVEVVDEKSGDAFENPLLEMNERRVTAGGTALGAVAFDAPNGFDSVKLVIVEDGTRVLQVKDIEL